MAHISGYARTTETLDILLTCGGGRSLVSLLYKAMRVDYGSLALRAWDAWNEDLQVLLLERECMTPARLHHIDASRSHECPR